MGVLHFERGTARAAGVTLGVPPVRQLPPALMRTLSVPPQQAAAVATAERAVALAEQKEQLAARLEGLVHQVKDRWVPSDASCNK